MDLASIRGAIGRGDREVTLHAQTGAATDCLLVGEVWDSILDPRSELVEENPTDPRGPTCLILSWVAGRPVHSLVAYPAPRRSRAFGVAVMAILVTLWRPDERPGEWASDFKTRLP